jgi:hypothetical protein
MGQFKPMVKMFTNEPSVILKLKKGGKVASKDGFKTMHKMSESSSYEAAEHGMAPKKPSMMARRRAMNPQMYAKGGKVAQKQYGGGMGAPAGAMAPMGRAALGQMTPTARAARAAMVRRALTGMKKGGSAADCAKLERELKHHEAMSAKRAHGKASGGKIDAAETKTTVKTSVKPYAKTKMDTAKRDSAHGTRGVKEGKPGGYAMGGTIEGNEKPFENTKVVGAGKGKTGGVTGGVRMGNAGGFKKGGKIARKKDGGLLSTTVEGGNWENRPANTAKPGKTNTKTGEVKEANAGGFKKGGKIIRKADGGNVSSGSSSNQFFPPLQNQSMNFGNFSLPQPATGQTSINSMYTAPTAADQAAFNSMYTAPTAADQTAFKSMYTAPTAADQASFNAMLRPENQAQQSAFNMMYTPPTQEQQNAFKSMSSSSGAPVMSQAPPDQAYRRNMFTKGLGYASGGNVVDTGKAEKMPRHPKSQPVSNSRQSGTFKKGGKVKGRAYGGSC